MATRANIILKDSFGDHLYFYKHSDGYPDGTLPLLTKFLEWAKSEKIRDNVVQAGGWLIMIGNSDYEHGPEPTTGSYSGWKVGSIEPTTDIHGDIEYLYLIDLENKNIKVMESGFEKYKAKELNK